MASEIETNTHMFNTTVTAILATPTGHRSPTTKNTTAIGLETHLCLEPRYAIFFVFSTNNYLQKDRLCTTPGTGTSSSITRYVFSFLFFFYSTNIYYKLIDYTASESTRRMLNINSENSHTSLYSIFNNLII